MKKKILIDHHTEVKSPNYPAMARKLQQAAREAITARGQMLKELDKGLRQGAGCFYSSTLSINLSK